jgi:hypothetical protein
MAQTNVAPVPDMAAHPAFARVSRRIPRINRSSRRDLLSMTARIRTARCPTNPIFGRARPDLSHGKRLEVTRKVKPMTKSAAFDLGYTTPFEHYETLALLDTFACVLNLLLADVGGVRRGDYHLILRKR